MYRLVYRFIGEAELQRLQFAQRDARGEGGEAAALRIGAREVRHQRQFENAILAEDWAEELHTHTMTAFGGGAIGGGQQLVSMCEDVDRLAVSTDPQVQVIVRNAPYIVMFQIRRDAIIAAASPLSQNETELITVNDLAALGAMMVDVRRNPYRRGQ